MKNIIIVGAGFSGMSLAYFLNKKGCSVSIIEKNSRPGGLISTEQTTSGLIETAANGFLNTADVEIFLKDIGVDYIGSSQAAKKRFIFREKPKRWPLLFFETALLVLKGIYFLLKPKVDKLAGPRESVQDWSDRHFTTKFTDFILAPALQGIYAGDIEKLSGNLIINPLFTRKKTKKLSSSSLLSAPTGMGSLMKQLEKYLIQQGVQFIYGKSWSSEISADHLVIATSASEAAEILQKIDLPQARDNAVILKQVEMEPLVSVTCFFEQGPAQGKGFGVLFPRTENIRALGVLMNDIIFKRNQSKHSETWIFGGALDQEIMFIDDASILQTIQQDREKVFNDTQKIIEYKITRWPKALPHYSIEHEKKIHMLKPIDGVTLHGNYLGALGLSRILEKSQQLAETFKGI